MEALPCHYAEIWPPLHRKRLGSSIGGRAFLAATSRTLRHQMSFSEEYWLLHYSFECLSGAGSAGGGSPTRDKSRQSLSPLLQSPWYGAEHSRDRLRGRLGIAAVAGPGRRHARPRRRDEACRWWSAHVFTWLIGQDFVLGLSRASVILPRIGSVWQHWQHWQHGAPSI